MKEWSQKEIDRLQDILFQQASEVNFDDYTRAAEILNEEFGNDRTVRQCWDMDVKTNSKR